MENRKKDGQVAVEKIVVTAIVLGIAAGILFNYGASLKSTGLNAEQKTENVFNKSLDEGDDAASSGDVATDINAEREDENYLYANIRPAYVGDGTGTYMNDQYEFVSDLDHQYVDVWVQFKKLEDGTLATASCSDHDGDYPDLIVNPISTMGKNLQGKIKFPTSINKRNISIIGARTFRNTGFNNLFELPGELKTIEGGAFEYMGIRQGKFSFPKKLEYIGKRAFTYAFNDMEYKEGVSFPDSLAYIGPEAFINGRFKGNLKLPQNLSFLGDSAFAHCTFSGSIVLPQSLLKVGDSVFFSSTFSGDLILPSNLQSLGSYVFDKSKFDNKVVVPDSLTQMGKNSFETIDAGGL